MAAARQTITGFIAGETDPLLDSRTDTDHYAYGLSLCENFVPINEGPLVKRPGFIMIRPAASTAAWLSAFRFSVTQEYALEWSAGKLRFYTNGGRIESDAVTPYEVTVPYSAANAPRVCHAQNYDRLYLTHGSYPPAALRRDTATTFTLETTELLNGPFLDGNTEEADALTFTGTLTVGGSVTITGPGGFTANHVGALLRVECEDFSAYNAWEPQMDGITASQYCRSDGKVYQQVSGTATGTYQPTHTSGEEWDGLNKQDVLNAKGPYGVLWQYVHDLFGIVKITGYVSATEVTGEVMRRLPSATSPFSSWRWAHGAYSIAAGWPQLCALWQGRMIHIKDFDVIGSVVGDFGGGRINFSTHTDSGVLASDLSFRRRLQTSDAPHWIAVDRRLLLGTPRFEMAIGPTNPQAAVSGENISADPQSFYGSEPVTPIQAGTETMFVERGGRRLRGADYDFARDRYDALDITATARHITKSGIIQLAEQRIPHNFVYGVRSDGQLVIHAKSRIQVKGLARMVLGGGARVLSAVSIVGADGRTDELWVLVIRRNGAGVNVREIWKQATWRELGGAQAEAFFVDGGVRIAASGGQRTFTGLDHLAGQAIGVLANGAVVPNITVANDGSFSIPEEFAPAQAYVLIAGLKYTARATSLRPDARVNGQSTQGLLQRIVKAVTRVLETVGLKLAVPGGPQEDLIDRKPGDDMDAPIPLFSGDTPGSVEAQHTRDGRLTWISEDPLPAIITGAYLKIDVDTSDD